MRCMERVTWKLTLPYVKNLYYQWEFAVCLKDQTGLCINLEGWDGEGDGKKFQEGGHICIPKAD